MALWRFVSEVNSLHYNYGVRMDYEKHVKEFSNIAREYCEWVENKKEKKEDIYYLQVLLSKLYCWGIQLPDCEPSDLLYSDDLPSQDDNKVLNYFSDFPYQYYSTVFNAEIVPSEEPVTGDIIDDLSNIYKDLKDGLWYLDQGSKIDAVFQWRVSLGFHWARHILSAMHAIFCHE